MRKVYKILIVIICILITGKVNVFSINSIPSQTAKENTPIVDTSEKIYDYADLLSESEETDLFSQIQEYINTYEMDMAVVTIEENNKLSAMAYADDFYDYNDFGIGTDKSGVLFLIDMENREMWISTTGYAISIYTDSRIDSILDYAYNKISTEDYNGCVEQFIKYAKYYANLGSSYQSTSGHEGYNKVQNNLSVFIKGSLIISLIVTIIYIIIGLATHTKPKKQQNANLYISSGIKLNKQLDNFVNQFVTKTRIESSSSGSSSHSSGHSSTHSGSSGSSHGGGRKKVLEGRKNVYGNNI